MVIHAIGIELNPAYAKMADARIRSDNSLFSQIAATSRITTATFRRTPKPVNPLNHPRNP